MSDTNNELLDELKKHVDSGNDVTDEDIRQLVIYYATIARDPRTDEVTVQKVLATWRNLPPDVYDRFIHMVVDNAEANNQFWVRPATVNLKYEI